MHDVYGTFTEKKIGHKTRHRLSLADSIVWATASQTGTSGFMAHERRAGEFVTALSLAVLFFLAGQLPLNMDVATSEDYDPRVMSSLTFLLVYGWEHINSDILMKIYHGITWYTMVLRGITRHYIILHSIP